MVIFPCFIRYHVITCKDSEFFIIVHNTVDNFFKTLSKKKMQRVGKLTTDTESQI